MRVQKHIAMHARKSYKALRVRSMMIPRTYIQGRREFKEQVATYGAQYIVIPTSKGTQYDSCMLALFLEGRERLGEEKIYTYIPPRSVGHDSSLRIERIPMLTDTSCLYLIIDDVLETGKTLNHALGRVTEQNVPLENIWCCVSTIFSSKPTPLGPFLDRAAAFQQWIATLD